MALEPLATLADLEARGVDTSNTTQAETMLEVASAEVRAAAGSPVSQATSTVNLAVWPDEFYVKLPGLPVTAVETVVLDGEEISDYKLVDGMLWRSCGWAYVCPSMLTVTYTHGLPEVPADIVDLVCSFAAAGLNAAESGDYGASPNAVAERIDDYSVTYAQGAEAVSRAMEIPPRTRRALAVRFGGGMAMVRTLR